MPTITIRLSEQQKVQIEHAADLAGLSVSEFVRSALAVSVENIVERTEALERRMAALETIASS